MSDRSTESMDLIRGFMGAVADARAERRGRLRSRGVVTRIEKLLRAMIEVALIGQFFLARVAGDAEE